MDHNALWVKVVKHKYNCGMEVIPNVSEARSSSNLWRGVCRSWGHVKDNIGSFSSVNFWSDDWLPSIGPLINHVHGVVLDHLLGIRVGDLVNHLGGWELDVVEDRLPHHVRLSILGHPPTPSAL